MELCDKSWNLTNFTPEFYTKFVFFANIKKFSISLESALFPSFSAEKCSWKFKKSREKNPAKSVEAMK